MVKTILSVDGMMCHKCEKHMEEAIKNEFEVKSVKASSKDRTVIVSSKEELDRSSLERTVVQTGYSLTGITVEQ